MGESLTEQYRVRDEDLLSCKPRYLKEEDLTVPGEEAPANSVPAAAVRRREQALSGFTGRKERVGGPLSRL